MRRFLRSFVSRPRNVVLVALVALLVAPAIGCKGAPEPAQPDGVEVPPSPATPAPSRDAVEPVASADAAPGTDEARDTPRPSANASPEVVAQVRQVFEGAGRDTWFGVYMGERKVGHGHLVYRRSEPGEAGALATVLDLEMTLDAGGRQARMTVAERRYYADAPDFSLVATEMELHASGMKDLRRAERDGAELVITRKLNGVEQPRRTVPASRDNLAYLATTNPPKPAALTAGATHTIFVWDWEGEGDDEVVVSVDRVERRMTAGIEAHVAHLSLVYEASGLTMRSEVAGGGSVLSMSLGAALTLRQEEEDVAKSDVVGLDVARSGVRLDAKLGDPREVTELVLKGQLPDGFTLPDNPRQWVEGAGQGGPVRITLKRGPGAGVSDAEREAALTESPSIDAKAQTVVTLAASLTDGLATRREKVDALARWVFENLDKRLATHLPTASAVLARKVGDCTEHTWLFTALARAAGIPARPVYGVAWAGDLDGRFAYHAWAEVELDGAWWAVDPTWDEPVADATHLELGSDLKRVGAVVGGLSLELVSVKKGD